MHERVKKNCSQPYLREEVLTQQIATALQVASLPDETADWLFQQLDLEHQQAKQLINAAKQRSLQEIEDLDKKLDRLTVAYLDAGAFSAAEFRKRKAEMLGHKRKVQDSLAALESEDNARFEPLKRFINGSKQLKYVAHSDDSGELRGSLQKVGSNLTLRDRNLHWEPHGAWQLVVDQGLFAQRTPAPAMAGAVVDGKTHQTSTKWSQRDTSRTHIAVFKRISPLPRQIDA
jgi:hypothetical protein